MEPVPPDERAEPPQRRRRRAGRRLRADLRRDRARIEAWRITGGAFDPTILPALESIGYDRDFAWVDRDGPACVAWKHQTPGCAGIELDPVISSVRLPEGVAIDLGGIGKGLAADLVACALVEAGAEGVMVNLGGDARVAGVPPRAEGWIVDCENPLAAGSAGTVRLAAGAVCTSTRLRRSWTRGERAVHHLIDPSTGTPSWSGLASVTVLAAEAWWAEVLAKAAFVAGPETGADLLRSQGVTGLFVRDDGRVQELTGLRAFR